MKLTKKILTASIILLSGWAVGAPEPGRTIAPTLNKTELQHYWRLIWDTCYMAPTDLQPQSLVAAEKIWQLTDGWNPAPPTDEDFKKITKTALAHYELLRGEYPVIQAVVTTDGEFVIEDAPEKLELTRSLMGMVLVELENETESDMQVQVLFEEFGSTNRAPVMIPSGQWRPILLPVNPMAGGFEQLTLNVLPINSGGEVKSGKVAVEILEPVLLKGKALNSATGEQFPSRVYCAGPDGIYRHATAFANNQTVSEKQVVFRPAMQKIPFFYTDGEFEVFLPAGEATVTLERGYETPLVTKKVDIISGQENTVEISSERNLDMKKLGWYSGDTHIHWAINPWNENEKLDLLALVQKAEDLCVANNLTLYQWLPDGKSFTKPDQRPMGPIKEYCEEEYHMQMAEEFRNDGQFGHLCLLNLKELVEPISTGKGSGGPEGTLDYPLNKWIIEQTRAQGGISTEAHNLGPFNASGVPVNVMMGYSDALDQLQPEPYYNFLNCGLRIGLANGSDHPARLAGICRVYVKVDGDFTYDKWCENLAKARTFTTSGPLLFLDVNGADIGDVIDAKKGDTLTVKARAVSRHPLGTVEVVSNGQVIKSVQTDELEKEIELSVPVQESMWFCVRASQSGNYDALSGPNIAHTSAVYVDVDGKPVVKKWAAQYWLNNIKIHRDRLIQQGQFEKDEHRQEALDFIDAAVAKYQALVDEAGE